jgi:hypothetical protein
MSQQKQMSTISGSIYDVFLESGNKFKCGRLPYIGQRCRFEDGREFVFCGTAVSVQAGQVLASGTATAAQTVVGTVAAGMIEVTLSWLTGAAVNA